MGRTLSFLIMLLPTPLTTSIGGYRHSNLQEPLIPSQVQLSSWTDMPSWTPVQVLASALLLATSGKHGVSSQVGRQMEGILDWQRPLVLNFSCALSAQKVNPTNSSKFSGTTEEWLKDGGREGVGIRKPTKYSDASTTSQISFLSQTTFPVKKTQQISPQGDFTHHLLISSQKSAFQTFYGNILSTSTSNSSLTKLVSGSENIQPNSILDTTLITHCL